MDQFEYVTTLVSFIVAFGVSRLLSGWVHQFTHRTQSPIYPLQVAVSALLLIGLLQNAWAMWFARDAIWTFGIFLLYILTVLALVGASALVHPPLDHRSSVRDHYFDVRPAVFGLCAVWITLGGIMDLIGAVNTPGPAVMPYEIMFTVRGVAILTFAFMARSDRPSHHWAGCAVSAVIQIVWILGVSNSPAI